MAKIIGVGTSTAPYKLAQSKIKEFVHNLFSSYPDIDNMIKVFDNAQIQQRHISVPIEWFKYPHTFSERNEIYRENPADRSGRRGRLPYVRRSFNPYR